jgi:hypothetical protein
MSYSLNPNFEYLVSLQNLILNTPIRGQEIYERINAAGIIKLLVTSGIFTGQSDVSLDLLIVGDRIKDRILKDKLRILESEIGRELRYTYFSTEEFFYRLNINDRLVRDVFDFPHDIIFDRLEIGLR